MLFRINNSPPGHRSRSRFAHGALSAAVATLVASMPAPAQAVARDSTDPPRSAALVTLGQLLDSVRTHHPLVEAGRARIRAARGARTTAGTLGNPILAYQVDNIHLSGAMEPWMDREAMATATIPLEPLYQRGARVRRADADVRAAEADADVTTLELSLDAAHTYYRTALAQVGADATRDIAAWLDTVVAYNRTRVKEGVAAEADLLRSQLERDRAAADATMQEADLVRARASLAAFLGDPRSGVLPAIHSIRVAIEDAPLAMPVASAGLTLASRPRVRAARERETAAVARVATERSMLVRQLGATIGTTASAGSMSLVAGVSLPFPLFDQNRGEIARATGERDAATFELAAAERTARAELTGAYEAARLLTERTTALTARGAGGSPAYLARADEARRIALGAYREGAVPLLSVIDAARAWNEARLAYYRTLFAQHESVLALLAAQGVDLTTAAPRVSSGGGR